MGFTRTFRAFSEGTQNELSVFINTSQKVVFVIESENLDDMVFEIDTLVDLDEMIDELKFLKNNSYGTEK
jgi:hypothetical protein